MRHLQLTTFRLARLRGYVWILFLFMPLRALSAKEHNPDNARAAYYRRALPAAKSFITKTIAPGLVDPVDRGNETYVEAKDGRGVLLGYLRDFTGPVSPAEQCPCSPLSLTLVFDAHAELIELLSPQPLQKYGHAPMTSEERKQLLSLCRNPPQALLDTPDVDGMLDATTGATRRAVKAVVVPQAALSTRRIVGITKETQAILRGAPGTQERARLQTLIAQHEGEPSVLAPKLATFLQAMPVLEATASVRQEAWRAMSRAYADPARGCSPHQKVEEALIDCAKSAAIRPVDLARACLRVAVPPSGATLLARCEKTLLDSPSEELPPGLKEEMAGTRALLNRDAALAVCELESAAKRTQLSESPQLFLRLAQAHALGQDKSRACAEAQELVKVHPRLPGAQASLASCFPNLPEGPEANRAIAALSGQLRQVAHANFLATEETSGPMRPLKLMTLPGKEKVVAPGIAGRTTVLVFFATWCPHCRMELPEIRRYVASLATKTKERVRFLGIRTAFERESEPWPAFAARYRFNYEVLVDTTMSANFAEFTHLAGLPATLPTTAVLDELGRVRFQIAPGDWGDPFEQLGWALEKLEAERSAVTETTQRLSQPS